MKREKILMEVPFGVSEDGLRGHVYAAKVFFSRECVLAVSNLYAGKYDVSVEPFGTEHVKITIYSRDGSSVKEEMLRRLTKDLVDYQMKMDLQKEFCGLRDRIVEYAFAPVRER